MTPTEFKAALAKSGVKEEKALHAILMTVWEAAETAHSAVTTVPKGLTPEGERALIEHVGSEAAAVAEREVERLVGRADLRRALQLAVAGLVLLGGGYGVGRWDGQRQGAAIWEASTFLAQIASLNDARALAKRCRETERRTDGGTACDLPPVWVKRP